MSRSKVFMALVGLVCVFGWMAGAFADGMIMLERPRPDASITPMAVKYHKVDVTIDNQMVQTSVDQEFHNPNNMQLQGIYIFPIPDTAAISNFGMEIDGKMTEAELLDADQARQTYENIVRQMQDPALLEYMGSKAFKLRIFPIEPNSNKRIKLTYSEKITSDSGLCTYRYPLNTEKFSSSPLDQVVIKVTLKSNVPVKNIYSPSHPAVDIVRKDDYTSTISFEEKGTKPDKDFVLYYTLSEKDFGLNLVTFKKPGEDGYFMAMLAPKHEIKDSEIRRKDVVFVMDTSLSMADTDMKDKSKPLNIDQAKKALAFCISSLNTGDKFNIVRFSTDVRSWKPELQDFTDATKAEALDFIKDMRARGGTNINDALLEAVKMQTAVADRPFMVIFITDGQPTVGETTDTAQIIKNVKGASKPGARVFCLGVGYELNMHLLDKLAEENRGSRDYVSPEENLEVKVSNFFEKVGSPILSDAKVEFGIETSDVYPNPSKLPDIFKGSQTVVFGRYKGDGQKSIIMTGKTSGTETKFVYEGKFAADSRTDEFLPRLWAMSKIGYLMDQIRLHGETAELKKEVAQLAKEYGVVTKYTSFLVLEDIRMPRRPGAPVMPMEEALKSRLENDAPAAQDAQEGFSAVGGARGMDAGKAVDDLKSGRLSDKDAVAAAQSITKQVGEKTFYTDGKSWYDSTYKKDMTAIKVKYLSDEYFKLLKESPKLGKYFSLGDSVFVVADGQAYEVFK
jgi:Ca-activated chloride channel family protein